MDEAMAADLVALLHTLEARGFSWTLTNVPEPADWRAEYRLMVHWREPGGEGRTLTFEGESPEMAVWAALEATAARPTE